RFRLRRCDSRHKLPFEYPIIFWTSRDRRLAVRCVYQRGDCDDQGGPIPRVASIAGMNIRLARAVFLFLLAMSLAFALRATLKVLGLYPLACAQRDLRFAFAICHDRLFDAHASQYSDICHNGSSGFGGNADRREMADLGPRTH